MSGQRLRELSEKTVVPVQIGLLSAVAVGIWYAAIQFHDLQIAIKNSWSWQMEERAWDEFERKNPQLAGPDIEQIRRKYGATN